jgi:hypothetical protein
MPKIVWEGKDASRVLDRLREEQARITDLTAAFFLSVDPPPEGQPSSMRGILFYSKGPKGPLVRIKVLGPFGRLLFDLLQKGNEIQVYVPSRRTLYQGKHRPEAEGNAFQELLTAMFTDFSRARASRNSALRVEQDHVVLSLVDGRLLLDRNTGLIRQWLQPDLHIFYDHYTRHPGFPPVPTHIRARRVDGNRRAICKLSQVVLNSDIADLFDLSGYRARFIKDLEELGRTPSFGR